MEHQSGPIRQQQSDALVETAKDATLRDITGWTSDLPGGRIYGINIDMDRLHLWCYNAVVPILKLRLHKVKRYQPDQLNNEVRDHSSALATQFIKCCYQHMRESAKVRYSNIVAQSMPEDMFLVRQVLPLPLARIVKGLAPIRVDEGRLSPCVVLPYAIPGADFGIAADGAHPWTEDSVLLSSALQAFKVHPELRLDDIDFLTTEGSGFWTVFPQGVRDKDIKDGFCCIPEKYYSEADKILAAMINFPLFDFKESQLVPIDWSANESDYPASWRLKPDIPGLEDILFESEFVTDNLKYTGERMFFGRAEILCAQVVSRKDHALTYVQPNRSPTPTESTTSRAVTVQAAAGRAKRKAVSTAPTDVSGDGGQPSLAEITTRRVRIGFAEFEGCCYTGMTDHTATQLFYKSLGMV